MKLVDAQGWTSQTSPLHAGSGLDRILEQKIHNAVVAGGLDNTRPIFVYLDEAEEQELIGILTKNYQIQYGPDRIFDPEKESLIPALGVICSAANRDPENNWGRFVPVHAVESPSSKTLYGWYYTETPEEIKLGDGTSIQIKFG